VQAVVTVSGAPLLPEPAAEKGFRVERKYYTLAGKPADPAKARQNDRFAVVLKITEPTPQFGRIIVADYLPAGFEIDNPRLVSSGDTGTLSWIEDAQEPVHVEFRDDHFGAAFNRKTEDAAVFTVAYVVRAVSPGRYVHPQAYVEDMYRPDRFGRTNTATIEVSPAGPGRVGYPQAPPRRDRGRRTHPAPRRRGRMHPATAMSLPAPADPAPRSAVGPTAEVDPVPRPGPLRRERPWAPARCDRRPRCAGPGTPRPPARRSGRPHPPRSSPCAMPPVAPVPARWVRPAAARAAAGLPSLRG